ncbi:MAG: glycosyltransferase family 2 protein [Haloarculaceae archaeon]
MALSVVVPTLNGREALAGCLDALAEHAPGVETVVVNGPSSDGTTGMVRDRGDVDVLVEVADRDVAAARNAGIERASGDEIAIVSHSLSVEADWLDGVRGGLAGSAVVTGPTHETLAAGMTSESVESERFAGREVTYFNPGNVAFERAVLDELDGYDEYLQVGSSRDLAHRLASAGVDVAWRPEMSVRREFEADGGMRDTDWGWKYRSMAYRLVKNYGLRPAVFRRLASNAGRDATGGLREVLGDETPASEWLGTGRAVVGGTAVGIKDGLLARARDRTPRRNPSGRSVRTDRAVAVYDWR